MPQISSEVVDSIQRTIKSRIDNIKELDCNESYVKGYLQAMEHALAIVATSNTLWHDAKDAN